MPLRLKSLELQGYKTFASRTLFEFSEGITAIVGPNGSGKSNIADALRWVLGEQSYGLLRAKRTEDMIFAGSESRPRAGMAAAAIIFDNHDSWLPVDFSEVAMGRRAYRDGRNDYLLNGQHVRLREINELLAQSGLGERTYTILGQGLVDASLALKADERRRLFEEAAGVGLYRARREETLRRLETTRRNLERVLDIMAELEPRLRSLDRQARRAREYQQLQNDLRLVLLDWYGYHWHKAQQELAESREVLRQQQERQAHARAAYEAAQAGFSTFRTRALELRSQLSDWYRHSSEVHGRREKASRDLAILEERQRALSDALRETGTEQERLVAEGSAARERVDEVQREVARLSGEFEQAAQQLAVAEGAWQARQGQRRDHEGQLAQARALNSRLTARRAELQAKLDDLGVRREANGERREELARHIQAAREEYGAAAEGHRDSQEQVRTALERVAKAEAGVEGKRERIQALEGTMRQNADALAAGEADRSRLSAQLDVLSQAEQTLAGYAQGARYLLEAARDRQLKGAQRVLGASLEVPPEMETAIAAALGDELDAVILADADLEAALGMLASEESGRAVLLALGSIRGQAALNVPGKGQGCLGLACELVSTPEDLRPAVDLLLGNTLIVRDRGAARRLVADLPVHGKAVTLQGEVFRGDGVVVAGKSSRGSLLSRPRERKATQATLASVEDRLARFEAERLGLEKDLRAARSALLQAEHRLQAERERLAEAQESERQALGKAESAQRQLDWQVRQQEEMQAEAERMHLELVQHQDAFKEVEQQVSQAGESVLSLEQELAGFSLEEDQEGVSYWKTRVAVAEQSLSDARGRLDERRSSLVRLETDLAAGADRQAALEGQLAEIAEQRRELQGAERDLQSEIGVLTGQIAPAEEQLASAEEEERRLQDREGEAQRVMTMADRQFNQVQVEVIRRQEALETLRGRIQDDFGLVMFEYAQDVVGPMPLPLDGMVEQLPVVKELPSGLDDQLARQRAQLRRLGPVNPEAQKEFESENQRYDFMRSQVEDLRKAEADLRQVISELDELTKQEFAKTFSAVDKEFREVFVRLFGGGSARLALTDPENLVETGIEIEARLPGRREQGLALLSGGERSLTAIALVFALLKVSPTPVCVMDEVDAMLDEANVGRFRDVLHELSQDTQFIIITHNRNTVQVADVIYGVTMGRDSVSQIISLRLDEVTDEYIGG